MCIYIYVHIWIPTGGMTTNIGKPGSQNPVCHLVSLVISEVKAPTFGCSAAGCASGAATWRDLLRAHQPCFGTY